MKVYLLSFNECLVDLQNKQPVFISSCAVFTPPEKLVFVGGVRNKTYSKLGGLTFDGLAVYKEIDEEIKQP